MRTDFTRAACHVVLTAAALMCVVTAGCSDGRPKRVPVSGQVLIDGKPLGYGFIRLIPADARSATGRLDADGRFQLRTFENVDGAVPGTHPVVIFAAEPVGANKQRWHAPKKYANARTSGLTATIDGPTDSLLIELSWEGGKPFVETVGGE